MRAAAYMGITADHLYLSCPLLARTKEWPMPSKPPGHQCIDRVDPLGTDICGWCQRVWRSRNDGGQA